jgi:hypothetical protein
VRGVDAAARTRSFGRVVHAFLELLYDFAVEVTGVQDEEGYRLDQPPRRPLVSWVDDGGSMPILDGRMRGIWSMRERDFYSGESGAGPIRPFAAINRWFNRRTRRGSMLSINANLKRRALELT